MTVRRTKLTDSFSLADYRERNPDAVLLFTHDGAQASVITEESAPPDSGVTLIALAQPRPSAPGVRRACLMGPDAQSAEHRAPGVWRVCLMGSAPPSGIRRGSDESG